MTITDEVQQLRSQGLTDSIIMEELTNKGYNPDQVHQAITMVDSRDGNNNLSQNDLPLPPPGAASPSMSSPPDRSYFNQASSSNNLPGNIYERIEEIAETMIDEKWDELIAEVKKIVEWKTKFEEKQSALASDVVKLKEDFKTLHQGVLGKLEDYDTRMRDVGTELKAVGKVFKDVVPEFVENVKQLSSLTERAKKKTST